MSEESILNHKISRKSFVRKVPAAVAAIGAMQAMELSRPAPAAATSAETRPGYYGAPRTWMWNPNANAMVDTSKWKKDGPYTIGFSNASISNAWRGKGENGRVSRRPRSSPRCSPAAPPAGSGAARGRARVRHAW